MGGRSATWSLWRGGSNRDVLVRCDAGIGGLGVHSREEKGVRGSTNIMRSVSLRKGKVKPVDHCFYISISESLDSGCGITYLLTIQPH